MRRPNLTWPQYCWKVVPMENIDEKPMTESVVTSKGSLKGSISDDQCAQAEMPDLYDFHDFMTARNCVRTAASMDK